MRIGMGRKASFCSQEPRYWPEKQHSGSPEAALPQTAGSYAGHPLRQAGHINMASGHGEWPLGLALLQSLVRQAGV
jgi:hypothetical protein